MTSFAAVMFVLLACKRGSGEGPDVPTPSTDSPQDTQDTEPCVDPDSPVLEQAMVIDSCWAVVAEPKAQALAQHLVAGDLLMGCEDEFPALEVLEEHPGDGTSVLILGVDTSLPEQGYRVRYTDSSVTLSGGSVQGLRFALTDFLASLERVELQGGAAWRPDATDALYSDPSFCSDYDATCQDSESCWDGGWTPVERVIWRPQEVDNQPDVAVRMAFASFKGTQNSHFLPNLVYSELGRCESPMDTRAFWEATLGCDRQSGGTCLEVQRRLDAVVAGRFTHALDEGHPMEIGGSTERYTGCDGALLYQDFVDYLSARSVTLVPTVFGLETRVPDTPIAGPRIATTDPAELWGVQGDATLSQGLGVAREFVACELDAGTYLAPERCEQLDETGHVVGPLWVSPRYDISSLAPPTDVRDCGPLELCATKPDCWETAQGPLGAALTPSAGCSNPVLRWLLPKDGRWYALHFQASLAESRDLVAKLVTKDTQGLTNALQLELLHTMAEESEYLHAQPGLSPSDPEMVRYSLVFRAPESHERLKDAYLQIVGVPGSGALIDELQIADLGAQLRHLDADSVQGPECLVVHDGAESPLSVDPYFNHNGAQVFGGAALQADCLEAGERVEIRYRSWTHFGLWPGLSTRQKTYTYTPGAYLEAFWQAPDSPTAQIDALDAQSAPFLLLSDLGGEARGVDRIGPLSGTSTSETLSSFVCQVEAAACSGCGDCDAMFEPFGSGDFEPCSCQDWPTETGPRLLIAGDMYSPFHNGGDHGSVPLREGYQVPHGGDWGPSWTARESLPSDALFLTWWHFDSRRSGEPVAGQETLLGFVMDYSASGHGSIAASAWDPDNQRALAALAAGSGSTHALRVEGVAQYGWGSDAQAARVMANAGRLFWSPGWSHIQAWLQSDNADLPGGDERGLWSATGFELRSSQQMLWPQAGKWQELLGQDGQWTASAPVHGARLLLRFHAQVPQGCTLSASFSFDGAEAQQVSVPVDAWDYRAWSASVAVPEGAGTVALGLDFVGCEGAVLDTVTLYGSAPVVDFPYAWQGEGLSDWDAAESYDARNKICGDPEVWDCVNAQSWR